MSLLNNSLSNAELDQLIRSCSIHTTQEGIDKVIGGYSQKYWILTKRIKEQMRERIKNQPIATPKLLLEL